MDGNLGSEVAKLLAAVEAQTAGLMQMLKIQAQQGAMLKEILTACTASEDGPSPLAQLINRLVETVEGQSATLARRARGASA